MSFVQALHHHTFYRKKPPLGEQKYEINICSLPESFKNCKIQPVFKHSFLAMRKELPNCNFLHTCKNGLIYIWNSKQGIKRIVSRLKHALLLSLQLNCLQLSKNKQASH